MSITSIIYVAEETAVNEWDSHETRYLIHGYIGIGPVLNTVSGFYCRNYTVYLDERDSVFCKSYNAKVEDLIHENGLPHWAPINRLISRQDAIQRIKTLDLFDQDNLTFKEKRVLKYILSLSKSKKYAICKTDDTHVLIISQVINDELARIDTLDLNGLFWMSSYQYAKKKSPDFPFDKIVFNL